ncbi:MAG: nitrilase family protein [Paludibacteraceae bacterium]|nr:nitrilase family protein [Paludibacteraceae bacterium]MBQ9296392.1 nitrilase family protein [Paludibacteraceae bacterium]
MKVALLQYSIAWADPQENVRRLDQRLAAIQGQADIAVVPEMFSTGFCTDRPGLAEPWGGETCQALQRMADTYGIAIMGSLIVRVEGDGLRNRGFMFAPHAEPRYIDKRHLYKHGGEAEFITAGDQREVWEYRGVKIRLAICYDLRFPVWLRQDKQNLYDILVVVGCWPTARIKYWDTMLPARGAENHCYAVGVNMVGTDGLQIAYNGHSAAYDTWLNDLAGFADGEEGTRIVELPMEKLWHFREVLPQWQDADEYTIHK